MPSTDAGRALRVAVVGHTNTGKTSLMRTLMRDAEFGEVAPGPATTRQVEGAALTVDGETVVELYDTPGLENAGAVLERLEALPGERHAGPDRIRGLLADQSDGGAFEQEARVLEELLACDAALYVIDAREPVLGKYQDELAVLALGARPLLPVLNFVAAADNRIEKWRAALARVNLHLVAEFDTVVFSIEAEARLWQWLAMLTRRFEAPLARLVEHRRRQARWQRRAACRIVSELLIDAAGCRVLARRGDPADRGRAEDRLRSAVVEREQQAVEQLLALYRFSERDYQAVDLPLVDGRWGSDLFEPRALARYAARTGQTAGLGAAGGAAFDLATGGLSLGAGTLIGTLAGAGFGLTRDFGRGLIERARGLEAVQVDDAPLARLAARQIGLVAALMQRGHASLAPLQAAAGESPWPHGRLPAPLALARATPALSRLNDGGARNGTREKLADRLARTLDEIFQPDPTETPEETPAR